jgi:hypothetical protein
MLAHGGRITGDELLLIASVVTVVLIVMPVWVRRVIHRPAERRRPAGPKSSSSEEVPS